MIENVFNAVLHGHSPRSCSTSRSPPLMSRTASSPHSIGVVLGTVRNCCRRPVRSIMWAARTTSLWSPRMPFIFNTQFGLGQSSWDSRHSTSEETHKALRASVLLGASLLSNRAYTRDECTLLSRGRAYSRTERTLREVGERAPGQSVLSNTLYSPTECTLRQNVLSNIAYSPTERALRRTKGARAARSESGVIHNSNVQYKRANSGVVQKGRGFLYRIPAWLP